MNGLRVFVAVFLLLAVVGAASFAPQASLRVPSETTADRSLFLSRILVEG
jgi:hypothetical protein